MVRRLARLTCFSTRSQRRSRPRHPQVRSPRPRVGQSRPPLIPAGRVTMSKRTCCRGRRAHPQARRVPAEAGSAPRRRQREPVPRRTSSRGMAPARAGPVTAVTPTARVPRRCRRRSAVCGRGRVWGDHRRGPPPCAGLLPDGLAMIPARGGRWWAGGPAPIPTAPVMPMWPSPRGAPGPTIRLDHGPRRDVVGAQPPGIAAPHLRPAGLAPGPCRGWLRSAPSGGRGPERRHQLPGGSGEVRGGRWSGVHAPNGSPSG
jgi:hypothetical protein